MTTCPDKKIDSNVTGLRYAWERCMGLLWPNPEWKVLEPNSYNDFGATITTVARKPINPSRQRKKGSVVDLDASGGFNQDLTQNNLFELAQGFLFANARQRGTTQPLNAHDASVQDAVEDTGVYTYNFSNTGVNAAAPSAAGTGYLVGDILVVSGGTSDNVAVLRVSTVNGSGGVTAASVEDRGQYSALPSNPAATTGGAGSGATFNLTGTDNTTFNADELVWASGFSVVGNNGLKTVVAMTGGELEVAEVTVDETAPAAAKLETVGFQFDSGEIDVAMNGGLVRLESGGIDLSTLGLIPGEWIFVGGDASGLRFANNQGFARVSVIDAAYLELDKVSWATPVAEVGTGKTIQIFFGSVLKNESEAALIVRKPVQLERTLGQDTDGTMSEYLTGAMANELTLNVGEAALVTADLSFVGTDVQHRTGLEGVKAGDRPALEESDAYNTTSDFSRIKLSSVDPTTAIPAPLFAFATDLSLTINNNVSPNKALGILGAFDTTAGTFEVGGSLTAYFADVQGPLAVRNNADISLDVIMVKNNAGFLFDVPLLTLGNGVVTIEQDQAITLPLDTSAAESAFGHTLLMQSFSYLPTLAGG